MGRKIEIKKIEETSKRQVTFSKRRSTLLKKAKEIAISGDVDVLLVAFSTAQRLSKFCSKNRYCIYDTDKNFVTLYLLLICIKRIARLTFFLLNFYFCRIEDILQRYIELPIARKFSYVNKP